MKSTLWMTAVALCLTSTAFAQAPGGGPPSPDMMAAREAMQKACATDMQKMCSGKEGREAMQCLRGSQDKASAGCKDALSKMPAPPARP
jgi:hypothetical protein